MSRRRQTAGIGAGRPYRIPLAAYHLARMRTSFATPIPPRLRRADIDYVPFPLIRNSREKTDPAFDNGTIHLYSNPSSD